MIICICNWFEVKDSYGLPTGRKELLVDYAVNEVTGLNVPVPCVHPSKLGAKWDDEIGEWIL